MSKCIVRCFPSSERPAYGPVRLTGSFDFIVRHADLQKAIGVKLDRRKSYALVEGILCSLGNWNDSCSGCTASYEEAGYADRGNGCDECGYTGRRKHSQWLPVNRAEVL
jgi:hypothetical protein